jgi:hypothetical protein
MRTCIPPPPKLRKVSSRQRGFFQRDTAKALWADFKAHMSFFLRSRKSQTRPDEPPPPFQERLLRVDPLRYPPSTPPCILTAQPIDNGPPRPRRRLPTRPHLRWYRRPPNCSSLFSTNWPWGRRQRLSRLRRARVSHLLARPRSCPLSPQR